MYENTTIYNQLRIYTFVSHFDFPSPHPLPSKALRVPVIDIGASIRANTRFAPRPPDTSTLPPPRRGAATTARRRGRRRGASRRRRAGDGGAGSSGASACARGGAAARDAEPGHVVLAADGDVVGDASAVDADQVGAVDILGPAGRGSVGQSLLGRAVGVAEDAGPLLERLVEVLGG